MVDPAPRKLVPEPWHYAVPRLISFSLDGVSEREQIIDVIRVYDEAGNVIETHQHAGEFKEW